MPTFFSEAQKSLATAMLDRLIPRQGDHPGAGEIGVADYLDGAVSASSQLRRIFSDGLIAVQAAAAALGSGFEGPSTPIHRTKSCAPSRPITLSSSTAL